MLSVLKIVIAILFTDNFPTFNVCLVLCQFEIKESNIIATISNIDTKSTLFDNEDEENRPSSLIQPWDWHYQKTRSSGRYRHNPVLVIYCLTTLCHQKDDWHRPPPLSRLGLALLHLRLWRITEPEKWEINITGYSNLKLSELSAALQILSTIISLPANMSTL